MPGDASSRRGAAKVARGRSSKRSAPREERPPLILERQGAVALGRGVRARSKHEALVGQEVAQHEAIFAERRVEPPPLILEGRDTRRDPALGRVAATREGQAPLITLDDQLEGPCGSGGHELPN